MVASSSGGDELAGPRCRATDAAEHVEGGAHGVGPEEDPRQAHDVERQQPLEHAGDRRGEDRSGTRSRQRSFTKRSSARKPPWIAPHTTKVHGGAVPEPADAPS